MNLSEKFLRKAKRAKHKILKLTASNFNKEGSPFAPTQLDSGIQLAELSNDQLLSLMRHEAHRIEKSIYNDIFKEKHEMYASKWRRIGEIQKLLINRGVPTTEPTFIWAKKIYDSFDNLEKDFIEPNSSPASIFNPDQASEFLSFLRDRRSVRVWSDQQPEQKQLLDVAKQMIDAARWAPTSGNRQPWRFLILKDSADKDFLKGIKEEHCTNAPLLIFVGMDIRVYGALGSQERSIFIDAGAAIMQMVLLAHQCGLGVCWNHFADDLIQSRESNKQIYEKFCCQFSIPQYISPIAVLAIGAPKFIPPEPSRMEISTLMI